MIIWNLPLLWKLEDFFSSPHSPKLIQSSDKVVRLRFYINFPQTIQCILFFVFPECISLSPTNQCLSDTNLSWKGTEQPGILFQRRALIESHLIIIFHFQPWRFGRNVSIILECTLSRMIPMWSFKFPNKFVSASFDWCFHHKMTESIFFLFRNFRQSSFKADYLNFHLDKLG